MGYQYPWSNFHEMNLDWILTQFMKLREDVDNLIGSATPSSSSPLMDGTASPGTSVNYSRGDHRHPTDTSRAAASALIAEATDRANADNALDGRLTNLEGRVVPSDAYPLMDGAAESGSHVQYSRRDHRHPTDTSRAAQTDLQAEINDRINDVHALQGDINTVDAKISFTSAAPQMDSSSASPGFSDYLARADHIHPTDTSRASQSDFDTLKARVDGFEGSANPSDTTPLMDGVGSAGTGGNYSRGDHVHPSDTSKLDVAGGTITGDLTVNGTFTAASKRTFFSTSAPAWMRVAAIPRTDGSKIRITVERDSAVIPAESHAIDLVIMENSITFENEESHGDLCYVNKIRYTNAGYLDIHMDQADASTFGVFIEPYASTAADTSDISVVATPQSIADAPVGETVLATYDLHTAFTAVKSQAIGKVIVDTAQASDNHPATITCDSGSHHLLVIIGASGAKAILLVNTSSAGTLTVASFPTTLDGGLSYTTATNAITITSTSYYCRILDIIF